MGRAGDFQVQRPGLGVLVCDESPSYSFSLIVQRRDRSVSQLNCRARTLLSVLSPPAIVRHLLVCTFLIWLTPLPVTSLILQVRDGWLSQSN
jgi:hypothetical protein